MNISGIRPAVGFYDYNSIKQVESVPVASQSIYIDGTTKVSGNVAEAGTQQDASARSRQTFGAYDYASHNLSLDSTIRKIDEEA